jgi:O-antigen ligase
MRTPTPPSGPSLVALAVLVTLVVLSPWPFGSAHPRTTQATALVTLVATLVLRIGRSRGGPVPSGGLVGPLVGLWLLACLQIVPLPPSALSVLAPGPSAVWYPSDPVAAGVLGSGARPLSVHPEATARAVAFATGLVALALLAAPALEERRTLVRAAVTTVSGGVLVALFGLVARVLFPDKLYGFLSVPTLAPFGPFVSKNHFAGYVEMAACLAAGLATGLAEEAKRGPGRLGWLDSPKAARVVFAWGAAFVLALAVPVSLSRGGTVSLAAGLLAFVLVRIATRRGAGGGHRALALAAAGLLVAGVGLASVLPPEARSRVTTLARTQGGGPDPFRLGVWRDALRLAAASPVLGSGLGAFEDALPRFKTGAGDMRVEHAENDYLELLAEGGVAAVGLAGLLIGVVLVAGLRRVREEPHRAAQGIRAGALAGVAALLVHSAFDFNLRIPSNALLFGLLVAMVLRPGPPGEEVPSDGRASSRRDRRALLVPVAVSLALAVSVSWVPRRFGTAPLARATHSPAGALRWQSLEREVLEHLRWRPADATAWVALAWLRAPASASEAAALGSWAVQLDPEHAALRRAAERVAGAQIQPRRP